VAGGIVGYAKSSAINISTTNVTGSINANGIGPQSNTSGVIAF